MNINIKFALIIFLSSILSASFTKAIDASEPIPKEVENATLQIILEYSSTGEASLKVMKVKSDTYEPEEMARLLTHWYSKILYLFQNPLPKMFLLQEISNALFEPKIKPKDNILKKAQIDDVVKMVQSIEKKYVVSSIVLYLQELPNGQRGLVSYFSGSNQTDQQTVFSWAIILQYASQNYNKKDLYFIHDIMGEAIKAYSAGADDDNLQNTIIIPNNAYFKVKQEK